MKTLIYLTTLTILIALASCSDSKNGNSEEKAAGNAMKESDLPANPESPSDVAKVFYYYLSHLDYEKANQYYSGTLHQYKDDEVKEVHILSLKAEAINNEAKVTFTNDLANEEVELNLMKVGDKWVINMYQTHSVNLK
ncbi:MAG: hypothetical protein A2W91_01670 [Bacteroidetes bacterium GWF2_38_335]|nr:MAG: hypothetical protein A2W91_01670 [Bacteroidetes bacterium GWF2_38_335]OFY78778.1 MAG: hypothetical protein A2281_19245 [Bacteroidetes bacterium RIFOXYA12_FULL_38_20]HBS85172.1 hypothetical protein [Bacteroidales bacterium]